MTRPTGFSCQNCDRICCWDCLEPDETIQEVKSIGSRYCKAPACLEVERRECNCYECRADGPGHAKATGKPCAHRGVKFGEPFAIPVEESHAIVLAGPPLAGVCHACGADLDELRSKGAIAHVHGVDGLRNYYGAN